MDVFYTLLAVKWIASIRTKKIFTYFVCLRTSAYFSLLRCYLLLFLHSKHHNETYTISPMFSPEVLGCLPMAQRRQSTSWMVLIFSSSFFFSGSLVTSVTSSPLSVLRTDVTWEFFHKSIPEFCSSLVQFVLMKLSKFLKTYRENMRVHGDAFSLLHGCTL